MHSYKILGKYITISRSIIEREKMWFCGHFHLTRMESINEVLNMILAEQRLARNAKLIEIEEKRTKSTISPYYSFWAEI